MSIEESELVTKKQKSVIGGTAAAIGLFASYQSYAVLPYRVDDVKARVEKIESRVEVVIKLDSQLELARQEIIALRREMESLRSEIRRSH